MVKMFEESLQVLKDLPSPAGKWELVEVIGEGNYGEVFKARNVKTAEIAAVKVMEAVLDKEEDIKAEINVFENHSHHPNIVSFFGAFVKKDTIADDQLWIVMEYCSAGSVTDLVKEMKEKGERLSEDIISYILREVLAGLSYLHSVCVLHRDVKGQNVLLTNEARVKLIDFGISAVVDKTSGKRRTTIGTPYWMAPEVIACESQLDCDYDSRADSWSLGITAIEIADSTPPLFGENPMRALLKIPKNKSPTVQKPSDWSRDFNDFIAQCLIKDYEQRPTSSKLLSHSLVRHVPKDPRIIRRKLVGLIDMYCQETGSLFNDSSASTSTANTAKRNLQGLSTLNTVEDLATLDFIDENVIVSQLWKRYSKQHIYTNVGDIVISINPFQTLDIYNEKFSYLYCHAPHSHLPPHIFAIAGSAYRSMMRDQRDQCCVVSGESGAGKTEASNLLVQQFMRLGRAKTRSLEEKILKVNPLIESFGNAKTIINENSSRFGKYLELRFTSDGYVVGAHLSEYLLEKSRVVSQARREKNFHIFYYLLAGLSARKQLKKYRLGSIHHHQHRYLEHRGTHKINVKKDALFKERFNLIDSAFHLFGFTGGEFECVCNILAAVLNLGDIRLESDTHSYLGEVSTINQMDKVEDVAYLLQIRPEKLRDALISTQVVTHGETIVKPTTIEQAMDTRDAIAKALYGRLFSWIVNKINPVLNPTRDNSTKILNVGILDIFGFENVRTNSFEQLCINVANEQLQFYFNQHVFAWEQEEYEREGVKLSLVSYVDNRPLLELLLTRPIGLLALLDEESRFPRATDITLAEKFHRNFKDSKYYKKPKDGGPTFTILHYAGAVISYPLSRRVGPSPTNCVQILMQAGLEKWVIGKTKVFLKYYHVDRLSQILSNYHRSATAIQCVVRGWIGRKVAAVLRQERRERAAVKVQTAVRGFLGRRRYQKVVEHRRQCAVKVQAVVRGWLTRSKYLQVLHRRRVAAIRIQTTVRGWLARQEAKLRRERKRKEQLKKQLEAARRKDSIRWKLHQHAIASVEIKRLEEEQRRLLQGSPSSTRDLDGNESAVIKEPSQGSSSSKRTVRKQTRLAARTTPPLVAMGYYDNIQQSHSTSTPQASCTAQPHMTATLEQSSSTCMSTTRQLFDGLITQQKEPTSPQKVRGRGRINLQHQRIKEKRQRVQNPNSIFQQLLNRFDPSSVPNSNASHQIQS